MRRAPGGAGRSCFGRPALAAVAVAAATAVGGGCDDGRAAARAELAGGDPERGAAVIREAGCGACHTIPGVDGAGGLVGPPLTSWSRRSYIAGALPNSPENLVRWIADPPSVEPGTAMPDLDLSREEARDVAAYLYTLR